MFRPDAKPQSQYLPPGTQIVDRSEVFGEHQAPNITSSSANILDNIIEIVVKEAESSEEQKVESEPEDDAFEFRLFSNRPVTKVSLIEEEPILVVTQRISSLEQEETEEFQEKLQQSAISYDDVMQQSHIPYPAMKMAHHIVHIPAETAKDKKKRKLTKRQRDRLKALNDGKCMRDPRAPGGWPGWPGQRTQCAITTSLRGQLKSRPVKSNKSFSKSPKGPRDHKPKPAVSRVNLAISQSTTAKEVTSNLSNL
ncbi:hypothetical protein INT43_002882 [Umbelopsis isabellina]|uniref:Uncharacterized protein n=1 Tax=Mortierella isabellina TaxID=91625 RepID=A0A8H7UPP2_MORIS|nr:hypothetical protein INT43_002882 [Umbelopsis isabellina]